MTWNIQILIPLNLYYILDILYHMIHIKPSIYWYLPLSLIMVASIPSLLYLLEWFVNTVQLGLTFMLYHIGTTFTSLVQNLGPIYLLWQYGRTVLVDTKLSVSVIHQLLIDIMLYSYWYNQGKFLSIMKNQLSEYPFILTKITYPLMFLVFLVSTLIQSY